MTAVWQLLSSVYLMPDVIDRSSGDDLKHMCMASSSWKQAFCDPGILRNAVLHLKITQT